MTLKLSRSAKALPALWRVALAVGVPLLVACGDRAPTSVDAPRGPLSAALAELPADSTLGSIAMDDALARILPALSDRAAAHRLEASLRGLRQGLDDVRGMDRAAVARSIATEVEQYRSIHPAEAADVAAMSLALDLFIEHH